MEYNSHPVEEIIQPSDVASKMKIFTPQEKAKFIITLKEIIDREYRKDLKSRKEDLEEAKSIHEAYLKALEVDNPKPSGEVEVT